MTAKEKAIDLIEKFKPLAHKNFTYRDTGEMQKAKQISIICVDETILALQMSIHETEFEEKHWQEVKTELQKL